MQTERIILRPWQESDAEALYKYASNPEVGPRAGWPPHKSVEDSLDILHKFLISERNWAVVLKETGEPIGCAGYLTAGNSNLKLADDECEVGYWIGQPYWNQGICTEAMKLVVDYCVNVKGFKTLWGGYFPENPASGRVMEKLGFIPTGEEITCDTLAIGVEKRAIVMKLTPKTTTKSLVVIDLQNDITKHYKDIIDNVNAAIDWAQNQGMYIVYIQHHNTIPLVRTFKAGTKGAELVPEMKIVSNNIFIKTKGNALTSKEFTDFIAANHLNEFYIAGADATACVKATCYNMRKANYTVHVISDCITTYALNKLHEMIEYYKSKGCEVKTLKEYQGE